MRFSVLAATTLASLAVTASVAAAQPSAVAPAPLPAAPESVDAPRVLDANVALGLSLGITAAGYGAFALADAVDNDDLEDGLAMFGVAAITLGPTTGHWYQERVVTRGLVTRAAGIVSMGYGVTQIDWFCERECRDDDLAGVFLIGGLIAFGVGTVDDIVSAPIEANRTNRKNRDRLIKHVSLAPQFSGDRAGVVLGGSF